MPDTITVLTELSMCFLASKKKIEFLRQIENGKDESELPPVKLLVRDRVTNINIDVEFISILQIHYTVRM